jgi:hypothetical protein
MLVAPGWTRWTSNHRFAHAGFQQPAAASIPGSPAPSSYIRFLYRAGSQLNSVDSRLMKETASSGDHWLLALCTTLFTRISGRWRCDNTVTARLFRLCDAELGIPTLQIAFHSHLLPRRCDTSGWRSSRRAYSLRSQLRIMWISTPILVDCPSVAIWHQISIADD